MLESIKERAKDDDNNGSDPSLLENSGSRTSNEELKQNVWN